MRQNCYEMHTFCRLTLCFNVLKNAPFVSILGEWHVQMFVKQPHLADSLSSTYWLFRYKISISLGSARHLETAVAIISIVSTGLQLITSTIPWQTHGMKCSLFRLSRDISCCVCCPKELWGERPCDVTSVEFCGSPFGHDNIQVTLYHILFRGQLCTKFNYRITTKTFWKINK
jgi:hypothetical protein